MSTIRRIQTATVGIVVLALAACTGDAEGEPTAVAVDAESATPEESVAERPAYTIAPTVEPTSDAEQATLDRLLAFEPALDGMFWYFDNDPEYQVMRGSTFFPPGSFLVDPPACAPIVASLNLLTSEDQGSGAADLVVDLGSLLPDGADPEGAWEELDPLPWAYITVRTMGSEDEAAALVAAPLDVAGCGDFHFGVEAAEDPATGVEVTQASLGDIEGVTRIRQDYYGFDDDPEHEQVTYLYAAGGDVIRVWTDGMDDPDAAAATLIGDLLDHLGAG